MKSELVSWMRDTLTTLSQQNLFPPDYIDKIRFERTKDPSHGDFATNIAMISAKAAESKPRDLAERILAHLPTHPLVTQVEIAGPGFINIHTQKTAELDLIDTILAQGSAFGRNQIGQNQSVQIEFVSANPTGPLHVGHGRGAAYGATLANILSASGYNVQKEYYVNDAGRQMHILAVSVWMRYLALAGVSLTFPTNGYKGDYIQTIANQLHQSQGEALVVDASSILQDLPPDEPDGGDKEHYIDALIQRSQTLLGERYATLFEAGLSNITQDIRDDLMDFGVSFDRWFSERSLDDNGEIDAALNALQTRGFLYDEDGKTWFRTTDFGDEKDRVVIRENGIKTYFASDIAYFKNKFDRGYTHIIEVFGADHHGYIPRLRAAASALGYEADRIIFVLLQFANLYKDGEMISMSTRSGQFVTLRELREHIGSDAARFYYVTRRAEQHLDFDLDIAISKSKDNPMYYIQYAHARVHTMLNKAHENAMPYDAVLAKAGREQLNLPAEQQLIKLMASYPETIQKAAERYEPHALVFYLREVANQFHSYYNDTKVLVNDDSLRNARLQLGQAVAQIIANGLELLGVSAPKQM